ncbi:hypothetical protein BX666DRAFT_764571 [Dichotomocladium elegans]|nr:hypothetical protein BX666DRAFT_764571 [Dichotomocladium elegans]
MMTLVSLFHLSRSTSIMKSLAISSIIALAVSSAAGSIAVIEPWSDSTWKSGGEGLIQWTSDPKEYENVMCNIQLMNGNPSNGQIVAHITEPQAPIPCTANELKVGPLNDFTPGDYWIRVGQGEKWTYSHIFKFEGKGTVDTHSLASKLAYIFSQYHS